MASATQDSRLVGRGAALAMAGAALDDASAGTGQFLLVAGEPGIGKSALLAEVAGRAAERGFQVRRGVGWNGPGAPPYWLWTQVLRGSGLGETGWPLAGEPAGGGSAEEAVDAQFRLFDDVAGRLVRLARDAPLVVVLDDLQWSDGPSLQLLDFFSGQVTAERVLILGAYRDTEAPEALPRLGGQVLPLGGLSQAEVGTLMAVVAGSRPSAEWAESVWRRCGGNPFFVRELTRLVLARGGWEPPTAPAMPDGVRDTLAARLARLSPSCAELLEVAAVAGPEIRVDVLAPAAGLPPDAVADLLDEAGRARVVVRDRDGLRLAHDLFRETILAGLSAARRAHLHELVGRALRELAGGSPLADLAPIGGAARLAAHFVAAGPSMAAEALHYCVLAAQEATGQLGHEDAARHYENALRLSADDPTRRVDLLLALAAARDRAGDAAGARDAYRRVVALARDADPAALARAALGVHALGNRAGADDAESATMLAEAAATLRIGGPRPSTGDAGAGGTGGSVPERTAAALRSRVLAATARMYRHTVRDVLDPRAREAAREAVSLAEAADDPAALAGALLAAHDVAWEPGSAAVRLPIVAAMADAAHRSGDRDLVAEATLLRAAALIELGDPAGRTELLRYTQLADDLGHARGRWGALSRRATLAELAGRADEARQLATAALRLGQRIGVPDAHGCFSTLCGSLGALGASGTLPVDEVLPDSDPLWPVFPLLRAWGEVHAGDHERAAASMRGFALLDIVGKYDLELLSAAATVCAAIGTRPQREWVYAQLEPHRGTHAVIGGCASYHGAVDHLLGLLAAALGQPARADRHFADAIATHDRLGTPAWAELSHRERGRLTESAPANVFLHDAGTWRLAFAGREAHLPDAKGLHDLAILLGSPGREIHVFTLLHLPMPPTGADPVLDDRARAEYATRLARLDADIAEADARQDQARSRQACAERDALIRELGAAAGLGKRRRRLGDETEKARKTIRARVDAVLTRIERVHPALAGHLRDTITTGTTCAYRPPDGYTWHL